MTSGIVVAIEGIKSLSDVENLTPELIRYARMTVNAATDKAASLSSEHIRRQIAFPATYLRGKDSRLKVTQRASGDRLEAVITGRHRATSLARFVQGTPVRGAGLAVRVKSGSSSKDMKRAFLMKLRAGSANIDTAFNMGLALRVPKGQSPNKAYRPVQVADGLFLLYGPSVDQVFDTVRSDIQPEILDYMEDEFTRLIGAGI